MSTCPKDAVVDSEYGAALEGDKVPEKFIKGSDVVWLLDSII